MQAEMIETGFWAAGAEEMRLAWLVGWTRETSIRRQMERKWTRALIAGKWRLADILFDHLWPGVFYQDAVAGGLWQDNWD